MQKRKVIFLTLFLLVLGPLTAAYELCDDPVSTERLEIIEILDTNQDNEINWSWEPTETITVEVEIRNRNFTERNFKVELFLLDKDSEIVKNFTTTNLNPTQTISLDENEAETLNFTFQIKEPNRETYYLYAKLYDENNESICVSLKANSASEESTITIEQEEKIIVVRNVTGPTNITAGAHVEYTAEVINLGNTKEDRVLVIVYNANLKIREEREIIELGVEESKSVTFNFTIPQNTSTRLEKFSFSTEYDYNEDNEYYYQSSPKTKLLSVQIEATSSQAIQTNQTENQVAVLTQNQTEETGEINQTETKSENTSTSYLLPILITVVLIITISIGTFFLLKNGKNKYMEEPETPTPASNYVKKIQNNSISAPTAPSKPSETNTANTKTPPTSQNPPQQPRSPPHPATTSSSPKSTPANTPAPSPAAPNPPQKSPPSPPLPKPNKTSSP